MQDYNAMSILSDNLREAMSRGNWTQQELADHVGINRSRVSDLLNGKSNPTLETMRKIADAVGVPLYQLLMPIKRSPEKVVQSS